MSRVHIVGVPICTGTMADLLSYVRTAVASDTLHHIMTPNNEMIVQAARLPKFHALLERVQYTIPDSTGLALAASILGRKRIERITGVDAMQAICQSCTVQDRVFLLGAGPGIALQAAAALKKQNPDLHIVGVFAGQKDKPDECIMRINAAKATIVFVAFGSPWQDLWIHTHAAQLPTVRIAMGVGGSFDFISGTIQRAPSVVRLIGCEWLWRFILQPSRYKRMFDALIVFPWLCLRYGQRKPV